MQENVAATKDKLSNEIVTEYPTTNLFCVGKISGQVKAIDNFISLHIKQIQQIHGKELNTLCR